MTKEQTIGVTVMPEYVQCEGIDAVLDNLVNKAAVTAITTSPYVMAEADEQTGGREPPIDAGAGSVRLLDRPLWGKRELWVKTAPSFAPNKSLYEGLRYQPAEPNELTAEKGHIVADFLDAAKSRGLKVYFQVMAAIPPGYRVQFGGPTDDDKPRLPDGRMATRRVSNNASLASPHIINYHHTMIRDLIRAYPQLDGIRFDWPEYPPYLLDPIFFDFSDHAKAAAEQLGFDFAAMKRDAGDLYKKLHGNLTDADLQPWADHDGGRYGLVRFLSDHPGIGETLRFKAVLSQRLLTGYRKTMNEAGGEKMEMVPNAFPPPWSLASGFDFSRNAEHSSSVCVKLYGMHWAMMLRFYGEQLLEANPGLSEPLLARALVGLLDMADDEGHASLDDYHYPEPHEPHPIGPKAQIRKIAQAQADAGDCPIHVLAHSYGPADDFAHRIGIACQATSHGVWVNRYGYLSDEKLVALGQAARSTH